MAVAPQPISSLFAKSCSKHKSAFLLIARNKTSQLTYYSGSHTVYSPNPFTPLKFIDNLPKFLLISLNLCVFTVLETKTETNYLLIHLK